MNHASVERAAGRSHLLNDGMTVRALVEHPLDRADLSLQPAEPSTKSSDVAVRKRECPRVSFSQSHDITIPLGVALRIPPGV